MSLSVAMIIDQLDSVMRTLCMCGKHDWQISLTLVDMILWVRAVRCNSFGEHLCIFYVHSNTSLPVGMIKWTHLRRTLVYTVPTWVTDSVDISAASKMQLYWTKSIQLLCAQQHVSRMIKYIYLMKTLVYTVHGKRDWQISLSVVMTNWRYCGLEKMNVQKFCWKLCGYITHQLSND